MVAHPYDTLTSTRLGGTNGNEIVQTNSLDTSYISITRFRLSIKGKVDHDRIGRIEKQCMGFFVEAPELKLTQMNFRDVCARGLNGGVVCG